MLAACSIDQIRLGLLLPQLFNHLVVVLDFQILFLDGVLQVLLEILVLLPLIFQVMDRALAQYQLFLETLVLQLLQGFLCEALLKLLDLEV